MGKTSRGWLVSVSGASKGDSSRGLEDLLAMHVAGGVVEAVIPPCQGLSMEWLGWALKVRPRGHQAGTVLPAVAHRIALTVVFRPPEFKRVLVDPAFQ